jgi:hypothetical protein
MNPDTVKAMSTNILTVLKDIIKWQVEDDGVDPNADFANPVARIEYQGEAFESLHGERPDYADASFLIQVMFTERVPDTIRDKAQEYIHAIRDNVTIDNMNVEALADTNLVSHTFSDSINVLYDEPIVTINYQMRIHYRET